jgi:hypothetical protein
MIRGEGVVFIPGVSARDVFDFVLDPAQYTKADTKMIWVTKLAETDSGMIAREDGRFLGKFKGSVVTEYRWVVPAHIDVTLVHGLPEWIHAWFEIEELNGGAHLRHVEEIEFGHGLLGKLYDALGHKWFADQVAQEVREIARLMEAGERGGNLDTR